MHILVADDETDLRELFVIALHGRGYDVTAVADGRAALDLLLEDTFDLVVLDWMMPGLIGPEVLRLLRAERAVHQPAVLMASALTEDSHVRLALGLGADGYLGKPFGLTVLHEHVARLLARRAAPARPCA